MACSRTRRGYASRFFSVLVSGTALALVPASARAQESVQSAQAAHRYQFSIPAGPLASALAQFGQQSGRQVTANTDSIRGVSTQGVQGHLTVDEALHRLLLGTGATYSVGAGSVISVQRDGSTTSNALQLDPVQVQGAFPVPSQAMIDNIQPAYAGGQVAAGGQLGLLGNRGVMDTPFNQTSYTAKKAKDQQATILRDVLVDDPSVRAYTPIAAATNDNVRIRGFAVPSSTVAYGGLYGMLPFTTIMAELAERIEVLKGPGAMLNGMPPFLATGGVVNVVPKRAPDDELTQFTAQYFSAGQVGGHVDVARRFGPDKEFGVRVNGVFRAGQTEVDYNSDQRALGTVGLDYRGERFRFSADLGIQNQYIGGVMGYLGVANGVALPNAPSARINQGQPWGNRLNKDIFGVARGEFDITDSVTVYAAVGAHDYRTVGLYSVGSVVSNVNGTATASAPINVSQYQTFQTAEAGLRANFTTGPIGHEFAVTGSTLANQFGFGTVSAAAFATNIYNPTMVARPNLPMPAATLSSIQTLSSVGFADTLTAASKRVQLTVGGRLQQVAADNFNSTTGAKTTSYDQSTFSPSVALVVRPFWDNVSFYANWIQGLQAGSVVPSNFSNAGEVFPPFKSNQYEAGVKVDWGRLTTTASVFQISQPSLLTNVTANTQYLGGEQVNQGLEINVFGEVTEGVRVLGGVMFLNAVLAKTQGGLTNGWIAPFSPGAQFNLAGEWDIPDVAGLTLTGWVTYTGSQYIDTTFPRRTVPEYATFDLGLRYAFENPGARHKPLVVRFNVDNVLGANYWAGGTGATNLYLGAPRTFRLSLAADF